MFEFVLPSDGTATTGYDITTDETITIDIDDTTRWLKKPTGEKTLSNLWPTTSTITTAIPTAGYVHWNDSTYQAYDSTALDNVYGSQTSNVAIDPTAWVPQDVKGGKDWNVYKLFHTGTKIDNVIPNGDAHTAMKVTVTGTANDIEIPRSYYIKHMTEAVQWLWIPNMGDTHFNIKCPTPTAPSLNVSFANVAGSGAQLVQVTLSSANAVDQQVVQDLLWVILLHLLEQLVVVQWHKLLQKQAVHHQHLPTATEQIIHRIQTDLQ